jgi:dTDP-4-amino-4,6-dideoxygalactose transaminase
MPAFNKLQKYIARIDDSKWYSNFGPLNIELTSRLANYFELDESMVCTISNATVGLQAVLSSINIPNTERVELPSFTFSASPAAVLLSGRKMHFVDIDTDFRCIPSGSSAIVMDVLPFGDEVRIFKDGYKPDFLLIDGAASFDALRSIGRNPIMDDRVAIVISLHSTKLIGGGEGGIILSKNVELIQKIKKWQNFGFDLESQGNRTSLFPGTNAKMSEYSCAVTLASLEAWPETREKYRDISERASKISSDLEIVTHPAMRKRLITPNWIVVLDTPEQRKSLEELFSKNKIETRKWWSDGCHNMPAFENQPSSNLGTTKAIVNRYLGLPFHLYLDEKYWDLVQKILETSINKQREA